MSERIDSGWVGRLSLHYRPDGRGGTTALDRHEGPLRVLQRLYPEGPAVCHHVLVHPPGGVAGGDRLHIDLRMEPGTHALVTTPGATRFYRSAGAPALQAAELRLQGDARLEWLPLESIAYDGCVADNQVRFHLDDDARMIGWDVLALGLPAAGAAFEHLAGTEARFRAIGQNSSDVLTLVDRTGVVTYQSSAVSRVFALPAVGLVGRPILEWVCPEDRDLFRDALDRCTSGSQCRIECRLMQSDGSYRYAETSITDLLDDPAVEAVVLNTHDVTDRRRLEDELRERALTDELTGLPNRVLFLERTNHALAPRGASPVVCFLDLDDFKAVNDAHGHGAGDRLLRSIGTRIAEAVRPGDTVARFGGDEFAILLEQTDLADAVLVVERLLEAIRLPVDLGDAEAVIHASIGIAQSAGQHAQTDLLLAEADAAMYAAKARGSNCYEVFRPEMRVAAESRSRVRMDLDLALVQEEFWLHYQPIVDLRTEQRLGVEALIRWVHPERGLLNPADFIDHAEMSGQIGPIGEWALRTACHATARLSPEVYTSVNISARQLRLPGLTEVVAQALDASGLPAERLVLEITETATVSDMTGAIARLEELKALGLMIALDDFGTGYSPLTHLRSFPVDILKIDRSFVRDVVHSEEDRAIVRGVIDIAHHLGLRTVAEGIEEPHQLEIMRDLGCDAGQGYLWTRPVALEALEAGAAS